MPSFFQYCVTVLLAWFAVSTPILTTAQCVNTSNVGQGSVSVVCSNLVGSTTTLDIGPLTQYLVDAGTTATRLSVTVTSVSVVTNDALFEVTCSGTTYTRAVDVSLGNIQGDTMKVRYGAVLPAGSTLVFENLTFTTISATSSSCGTAALCMDVNTAAPLSSLSIKNVSVLIRASSASQAGIVFADTSVSLSGASIIIESINITISNVNSTSMIAQLVGLLLPSTLILSGDSKLTIALGVPGALHGGFNMASQTRNVSAIYAIRAPTLTLLRSSMLISEIGMDLNASSASTHINVTACSFLSMDTLTVGVQGDGGSTFTADGVRLVQASSPRLLAQTDTLDVFRFGTVNLQGGSQFTIQGCTFNVSDGNPVLVASMLTTSSISTPDSNVSIVLVSNTIVARSAAGITNGNVTGFALRFTSSSTATTLRVMNNAMWSVATTGVQPSTLLAVLLGLYNGINCVSTCTITVRYNILAANRTSDSGSHYLVYAAAAAGSTVTLATTSTMNILDNTLDTTTYDVSTLYKGANSVGLLVGGAVNISNASSVTISSLTVNVRSTASSSIMVGCRFVSSVGLQDGAVLTITNSSMSFAAPTSLSLSMVGALQANANVTFRGVNSTSQVIVSLLNVTISAKSTIITGVGISFAGVVFNADTQAAFDTQGAVSPYSDVAAAANAVQLWNISQVNITATFSFMTTPLGLIALSGISGNGTFAFLNIQNCSATATMETTLSTTAAVSGILLWFNNNSGDAIASVRMGSITMDLYLSSTIATPSSYLAGVFLACNNNVRIGAIALSDFSFTIRVPLWGYRGVILANADGVTTSVINVMAVSLERMTMTLWNAYGGAETDGVVLMAYVNLLSNRSDALLFRNNSLSLFSPFNASTTQTTGLLVGAITIVGGFTFQFNSLSITAAGMTSAIRCLSPAVVDSFIFSDNVLWLRGLAGSVTTPASNSVVTYGVLDFSLSAITIRGLSFLIQRNNVSVVRNTIFPNAQNGSYSIIRASSMTFFGSSLFITDNTIEMRTPAPQVVTMCQFASFNIFSKATSMAVTYNVSGNNVTMESNHNMNAFPTTIRGLTLTFVISTQNFVSLFSNNTVSILGAQSVSVRATGISVVFAAPSALALDKPTSPRHVMDGNQVTVVNGTVESHGIVLGSSSTAFICVLPLEAMGNVVSILMPSVQVSASLTTTAAGIELYGLPFTNTSSASALISSNVVSIVGNTQVKCWGFILMIVPQINDATLVVGTGEMVTLQNNTVSMQITSSYSAIGILLSISGSLRYTLASKWVVTNNSVTLIGSGTAISSCGCAFDAKSNGLTFSGGGATRVTGNRFQGFQGPTDNMSVVSASQPSAAIIRWVAALLLTNGSSVVVQNNTVSNITNTTFVCWSGSSTVVSLSSQILVSGVLLSGTLISMVSLLAVNNVQVLSGSTMTLEKVSTSSVTSSPQPTVHRVVDLSNNASVDSMSTILVQDVNGLGGFNVDGAVVFISGWLMIGRRSFFAIVNNRFTMTGTSSNSLVLIQGTMTYGDQSEMLIKNNTGTFLSSPVASGQALVSLGNASVNVVSQSTLAVVNNSWNATGVVRVISGTSNVTYNRTLLGANGVFRIKMSCNYGGSPLALISNYTNGTTLSESYASQLSFDSVVACNTCDAHIDCFGPNTRLVNTINGTICECHCVVQPALYLPQMQQGALSLPCAPPAIAFTRTASVTSSGSVSPSYSGSLSESTPVTSSKTWSPTPSSSFTPATHRHTSSNSTSFTPTVTPTVLTSPSGSPLITMTPPPSQTPPSTHTPTDSLATTVTKRNVSESLSQSFLMSMTKSPSLEQSDSVSHSLNHSVTRSPLHTHTNTTGITVTESITLTESRSLNPCTMPWSLTAWETIVVVSASPSVAVPNISTTSSTSAGLTPMFHISFSVPFDVMNAAPVTVSLAPRGGHSWRLMPAGSSGSPVVWTANGPSTVTAALQNSTSRTSPWVASFERVTYNRFLTKSFSVIVDSTSFACSAKAGSVTIHLNVEGSQVVVSAAAMQAMTSITSSLSLATANPAAGIAASRVSMLRNLLDCTVDLTGDNGNSFTGYHFGPPRGQYSRGAVVGNIVFLVAISSIGLVIAAISATYGYFVKHKPWLEGFILVTDVLHYPSITLVPLSIVLQPTLTEATNLILLDPEGGDRMIGLGGAAIIFGLFVFPFTYVLLCDFRCVIGPRDEATKKKQREKFNKSLGWAFGNATEDEHESPLQKMEQGGGGGGAPTPVAGVEPPHHKASLAHRIIRALFEEEVHWVIANRRKTPQAWKRRFLFLFADFRYTKYCVLDLWVSVTLGIVAGVNLGVSFVCMTQLSILLVGFLIMFVVCLVFRPAFGLFAQGYVLLINAFGLMGASATFVASYNGNSTATIVSNIAAMMISSVAMVKTLPDLFLLVVALPTIIGSVARPFQASKEVHELINKKDVEMQVQHAHWIEKSKEAFAFLKEGELEQDEDRTWRVASGVNGGEEEDGRRQGFDIFLDAYSVPGVEAPAASQSSSSTKKVMEGDKVFGEHYALCRDLLLEMLYSTEFDMRVLVHDMIDRALPLSHREIRRVVYGILAFALSGGSARIASQQMIHDVILPRVSKSIDIRCILHDVLRGVMLEADRRAVGRQGIDDLIISHESLFQGVGDHPHAEVGRRTEFLTNSSLDHSGAGLLRKDSEMGNKNFLSMERSAMGALGTATSSSVTSRARRGTLTIKRPAAAPQAVVPKTPGKRQAVPSSSSSTSDDDDL